MVVFLTVKIMCYTVHASKENCKMKQVYLTTETSVIVMIDTNLNCNNLWGLVWKKSEDFGRKHLARQKWFNLVKIVSIVGVFFLLYLIITLLMIFVQIGSFCIPIPPIVSSKKKKFVSFHKSMKSSFHSHPWPTWSV